MVPRVRRVTRLRWSGLGAGGPRGITARRAPFGKTYLTVYTLLGISGNKYKAGALDGLRVKATGLSDVFKYLQASQPQGYLQHLQQGLKGYQHGGFHLLPGGLRNRGRSTRALASVRSRGDSRSLSGACSCPRFFFCVRNAMFKEL